MLLNIKINILFLHIYNPKRTSAVILCPRTRKWCRNYRVMIRNAQQGSGHALPWPRVLSRMGTSPGSFNATQINNKTANVVNVYFFYKK